MQVVRSMIGVDAAGIFCGDTDVVIAAVTDCDNVYDPLFGSPIRRARQLGAGNGVVVDCDDGRYEIVVDVSEDGSSGAQVVGVRETLFDVEVFLKVESGVVTICDTLCLLKPKSTCSRGDEWLDPLHFVRASVSPGTYRVKLAAYSRTATADDQEISRRVFTEEDHSAWWAANRAYVSGDLPIAEFKAEKNRIESRTRRVVDGIALSFSPVERIPVEHDPGDVKLVLAAKQDAAKLLERRRKAN